jgi:hypothetical protein
MIKKLAQLGMQLEGPAAVVGDSGSDDSGEPDEPDEWQSLFLMSPSLSIRGGTDEIQHNILGERVLGLPTEPRVDKDKPLLGNGLISGTVCRGACAQPVSSRRKASASCPSGQPAARAL